MFVSGVSLRLEKRLILWTHRAPNAKWKPVACCNVFCFLIGVFALCRRQRFSEHHYFAKVCVHGGLSACAWKAHWSELKLTRILQARGLLADLWPSWTKPETYSKLSKRFLIQTGTGISSTTFEIVFSFPLPFLFRVLRCTYTILDAACESGLHGNKTVAAKPASSQWVALCNRRLNSIENNFCCICAVPMWMHFLSTAPEHWPPAVH